MFEKKYAIIAPHVDDEVIGCFRLLEAGMVSDVVYLNDLTQERISEAKKCAEYFGFKARFGRHEIRDIAYYDLTILVPNIADSHAHHKAANLLAKRQPRWSNLMYYSVDMNDRAVTLHPSTSERKRKALFDLFPSQSQLFESDASYYLFESLVDTDVVSTKIYYFENARIEFSSYDPRLFDEFQKPETSKEVERVVKSGSYSIGEKMNRLILCAPEGFTRMKFTQVDPETKIGEEREFHIG